MSELIIPGQRWEHLVFGVITILEVEKDCNKEPYYIARVEEPRPEFQFGNAHFEGRTVIVTPRRPELQTGNRFMKLLP